MNTNGKDLTLNIGSALAGFTIANVNPDADNALDITTSFNNNVITIAKAPSASIEAAQLIEKTLKVYFDAQATGYAKESFVATITIDDVTNRTLAITVKPTP